MKITIEVSEVRELLRAGVLSVDAPPFARTFGEHYEEEVGLADSITAKRSVLERLSEEVAVLEAQAAAARPVVEANEVIATTVDLWHQLDGAFRYYCELQSASTPADTPEHVKAKLGAFAELQRSIRALGDQLGEEGGEAEDDPPC